MSLWFGRNEENGIRCPYHGWKYDVTGQCVEVPSEPVESGFCKKIKLKRIRWSSAAAMLWTYMGPPEQQPPLPEWEFAQRSRRKQRFIVQAAAGMQLAAGDGRRHRLEPRLVAAPRRTQHRSAVQGCERQPVQLDDTQPEFEVVESPGGLYIGARRNAENGHYYWRITPWVMPCFTMIPPRGDHPVHGHFWIPIDDENCWTWSFDYHPVRALTDAEVQAMRDGKGIHVQYVPGTYRPRANKDNDYLIDRAAQKAGITFSGVEGIAMQDASLQESMGPIVDRTKENLVSTDNGIIMARHRLLRAAKALTTRASRRPASTRRISGCVRRRSCCRWTSRSHDGAGEALSVREGVAHATVVGAFLGCEEAEEIADATQTASTVRAAAFLSSV